MFDFLIQARNDIWLFRSCPLAKYACTQCPTTVNYIGLKIQCLSFQNKANFRLSLHSSSEKRTQGAQDKYTGNLFELNNSEVRYIASFKVNHDPSA